MCLRILKEGLFTSLQGTGEYGRQLYGVSPRGAMDRAAVRLLNLLLRNEENDAALEFHFPAGEIAFEESVVFAIGGADFAPELSGKPIQSWRVSEALSGGVLRFPKRASGARCYLAVAGGLTHDGSGGEGYATRRLEKGEMVFRSRTAGGLEPPSGSISSGIIAEYRTDPVVRFVAGAEHDILTPESRDRLNGSVFSVSPKSDRMGFRLKGPSLEVTAATEMISASVTFGTMQLLPDGQLIVLMADHQTTGGYPRMGNVISADLPLMAQLGAGDKMSFREAEIDEAELAIEHFETSLSLLKTGVGFGRYW